MASGAKVGATPPDPQRRPNDLTGDQITHGQGVRCDLADNDDLLIAATVLLATWSMLIHATVRRLACPA